MLDPYQQIPANLAGHDIPIEVIDTALPRSLTVDAAGLVPGETGYTTTYDIDWATAEVCALMRLRWLAQVYPEQVKQIQSENTTIQVDPQVPVDWAALEQLWRLRSPLAKLAGIGTYVNSFEIDPQRYYAPASEQLIGGGW